MWHHTPVTDSSPAVRVPRLALARLRLREPRVAAHLDLTSESDTELFGATRGRDGRAATSPDPRSRRAMHRLVVGALGAGAFAVVLPTVLAACGSRTGLNAGGPLDASSRDAVVLDAPPGLDVTPVACPGSVPSTPAGQVLWQTPLVSDRYLTGPLAADPQGNTYFVDDGALRGGRVDGGSRVLSLDDCGHVRWNQPWDHFYNDSVGTHVLLSRSRLVASNGDVTAFDLTSGDVLWRADMVAFGSQTGIGDLSQRDSLGAMAAAADGTIFLLANTRIGSFVLTIDASGTPSLLAQIPQAMPDAGGMATDVIVDALGDLRVPITFTNVNPGPGAIVHLSRSGQVVDAQNLSTVMYQDHLMSAPAYLVSEDTGSVLGLAGGSLGTLGTRFAEPLVLDGQGALYAISDSSSAGEAVSAWAPDRSPRWTTNLLGNGFFEFTGGPLLGDGANVWLLRQVLQPSNATTTLVAAFDRATGAQQGWSFADESPGFALIVPPGELVFVLGQRAVALSTGGEGPGTSAWPTFRGGNDQRGAAAGQ